MKTLEQWKKEIINIRVNCKEKELIKKLAEKRKMSISDYIRYMTIYFPFDSNLKEGAENDA